MKMGYGAKVMYGSSFKKWLLIILCVVGCTVDVYSSQFNAEWIGVSGHGKTKREANRWFCFRKTFNIVKIPNTAITKIAVDSRYWLWVNDEQVVFEGQLKRGPNPKDSYYDELDLAPYLRKGENTISILQWYFGKEGFSHKNSGKPALLFELDLGGKKLLSDLSWKVLEHPAYGDTGEPHPNHRLPESNVHFDAQKDSLGKWYLSSCDGRDWPQATVFGQPPMEPWGNLVKRPIPLWKDYGLKNYLNSSDLLGATNGKPLAAKLPYNAQVTPYLKIDAPAGLKIDIRSDTYDMGPSVRNEYVTKDGVQEFEALSWINGHFIHYSIPKGVKVLALKFRESGYNTEFAGEFSCDIPILNRMRKKAVRTLYVNMRDSYFDCPERERAQWWGDMVNELIQSFYCFDTRSHNLAGKGMLELIGWQRPDGKIYSPVPAGNWDQELPLQMLNSIGYYGFWTQAYFTGDKDVIEQENSPANSVL